MHTELAGTAAPTDPIFRAHTGLRAGKPEHAQMAEAFSKLAGEFRPAAAPTNPKELSSKWKESLAKLGAAQQRTQRAEREGARLAAETAELNAKLERLKEKQAKNQQEIDAAREDHDRILADHRAQQHQGNPPAASQGTSQSPKDPAKESKGELDEDDAMGGELGGTATEGANNDGATARETAQLRRAAKTLHGICKRRKV